MACAIPSEQKFRCLIVDDLKIHCLGIKQVVKSALDTLSFPSESDCAYSEEEALNLCSQKVYNLIVMDYHMLPKNGVEITKQIKKRYPNALIVGCSTLEDQKLIDECLKAGMKEILPKDWMKVKKFILDYFPEKIASLKASVLC
jgi:DNA-binding NarL/FixJ family response regulator